MINAHARHNVKTHRPVPHAEVSKLFPMSVPNKPWCWLCLSQAGSAQTRKGHRLPVNDLLWRFKSTRGSKEVWTRSGW